MKTLFTLLISIIFISATAGELNPEVESFTTIKILGNYKVYLTKGDKESVRIVNNDTGIEDDQIETEVKRGELKIKISGDNFKEKDMDVYITYKDLEAVDVRRGAWIKLENPIKGKELTLEVASGGHIVGEIKCDKLYGAVSKGGSIKLNGTSPIAEYNVFAGGEISVYGVKSDEIIVKVRTGGDVFVTANNKFDAVVFSGGNIYYKGDPVEEHFKHKVKIAGDIKKMD